MADWGIEKARSIYNVAVWSEGYFDVNKNGDLVAYPDQDHKKPGINFPELTARFKEEGLTLPVLVRFTDILQHRVGTLISSFAQAKQERDYQGEYTAVYPIKVNQQFSVVKKLVSHDSGKVGLEAGSKPELMAILGVTDKPLRIVCNGYKDSEFLRLATIGQMMGHQVYVVVEKITELKTLIREIDSLGQAPMIGIRIKLNSVGKGKWQNTGGEKGKFGLTATQVLQAIDILREAGKLDLLQLVHFHIGSQIANIRDIHNAIRECARHYAELRTLGVPITTVDVGGGLGVDYEGSNSRSACSMNYTMLEYARNVVYGLKEVCDEYDLPHPNIITESGRAMTAHHAVLITDAIDVERAPGLVNMPEPSEDSPAVIWALWDSYKNVTPRTAVEAYHDAVHYFTDAHAQYVHGLLTLKDWSLLEQIYFATINKVKNKLDLSSRSHRDIHDELNEKLADKLFVNFSLFQSMPDAWGIDQLFPVMPLERMNETLEHRAIIQDITCDSDGVLKSYADGNGIESSLPLPSYKEDSQFLLGMFMVGAYQEILGDLHNLFGDTDSVHVELDEEGGYRLTNAIKGDTVADVLRYVQFDAKKLLASYQKQLARMDFSPEMQSSYLDELKAGVYGYTYFED